MSTAGQVTVVIGSDAYHLNALGSGVNGALMTVAYGSEVGLMKLIADQ